MDWMAPSALAGLLSTLVLVALYWYIYSQEKQKYLAIWATAWTIYLFSLIYDLYVTYANIPHYFLQGDQLPCLLSALCLLWGTYSLENQPMKKGWVFASAIFSFWLVFGLVIQIPVYLVVIPTFTFIAFLYLWNGFLFLEMRLPSGAGNTIVGWALVIWALHKTSYPLVQSIIPYTYWRYFLASILEITVAMGLLMIYYQKIRYTLRVSEERFRLLAENAQDIIFRLHPGPSLVFDYVSPSSSHITGYTPEEYYAKPDLAFEIILPEDKDLFKDFLENPIFTKPLLLRFRHKNGHVIWLEQRNVPVYDSKGSLICIEGIGRDITELKQAENRLREKRQEIQRYAWGLEKSNQELEQFAYVVSHDLKAPLRGIANLSEWLEEELGSGLQGESRRMMDLLRNRVQRMEALIDGILKYSRAGRIKGEIAEVDLKHLLVEIIDMLHPPPDFIVAVADNLPTIKTDRTRLIQVLANLIGNAIKHHDRSKGKVIVSVEDTGEFYQFTVADDGPGIAPEYHSKVFELFQTLRPKDEVENTGVGLSIVKKIVESQEGELLLKSEGDRGTIFQFTWPKK
ncbi:hypothetical protein JCM14036_27470 [Desulfotomaculum defluvii]